MIKHKGQDPILLAITGASGSIYSLKIIEILKNLDQEVHLIISNTGKQVCRIEIKEDGFQTLIRAAHTVYSPDNLAAAPASGSSKWKAMIIIPCTMGTLASIAHGFSQNLIHRAADCFLKERRPLILVPRETPLNRIHLQNMLLAEEAGAVIYPAMPSFYYQPGNIDEMASFFAGRLAEFIGLEVEGIKRWHGID
ncbi:MAG: UbiX family flavin prenyltransferase [Deltaproteobacteria bacterium]|nr:UbiX family flavin prenyltransferase [Deltaproteobacteria bacterium]MBW1719706.1 UbiX family flavin prenyltransferase [Deltaproteobacteria bacterium]MBW1933027.1 UbiX family flavin prenyltransferase [Deltaproteobacteria bacterium]MBW1938338.1 UbiX family flavin prenyltransferase [Deltaproteobacteria bacterium]MBW1965158.1 UbiX family flavin prenyltransferase [Deltaproteobacteria bacterium]